MRKEKFSLKRVNQLIFLVLGLTLLIPHVSQAIPLTNTSIGYAGPVATLKIDGADVRWYTDYTLNSDEFGASPAFCVENAPADSDIEYELIPVPDSLRDAALIADQFFNGGVSWSKAATQIAVWEAAFDTGLNTSSGSFQYNGGLLAEVNAILSNVKTYSFIGPIALAHSPPGSPSPTASQDYLIRAPAPVPEPATMLLLGTGLVGIAGFGRKKFRKG